MNAVAHGGQLYTSTHLQFTSTREHRHPGGGVRPSGSVHYSTEKAPEIHMCESDRGVLFWLVSLDNKMDEKVPKARTVGPPDTAGVVHNWGVKPFLSGPHQLSTGVLLTCDKPKTKDLGVCFELSGQGSMNTVEMESSMGFSAANS